jgi:hypothetical protein
MSLMIPPAKNYPGPLIFLRSIIDKAPVEGNRMVPIEIDWGAMGGPNNCVAFNLSQLGPLDFSQIVAISIDNSACGSDIQFIFTDSAQTYTVPAYAPSTTFEVFTNTLSFYVVAEFGEEPIDISRFAILNFLPPPFAIPATREQQAAVASNINITGAGSTQIIPSTVTGTIQTITVDAAFVTAAAAGASTIFIQDGDGKTLAGGTIAGSTAQSSSQLIIDLPDINLRFHNGVSLNQFGAWTPSAAAFLTYNIIYRTP